MSFDAVAQTRPLQQTKRNYVLRRAMCRDIETPDESSGAKGGHSRQGVQRQRTNLQLAPSKKRSDAGLGSKYQRPENAKSQHRAEHRNCKGNPGEPCSAGDRISASNEPQHDRTATASGNNG